MEGTSNIRRHGQVHFQTRIIVVNNQTLQTKTYNSLRYIPTKLHILHVPKMLSVNQFVRLAAIAGILGVASVTAAPTADVSLSKRDDIHTACGCEGQSDAKIEDCQKVIDWIDPNGTDATDIMDGVYNKHTGPLSSATVMHIEGTCGFAVGTFQTIGGPYGVGGGITGTTGSNSDVKTHLQAILDRCKDTDNGLVNGCASLGAGNVMLAAY
jgi:hypothetical protein